MTRDRVTPWLVLVWSGLAAVLAAGHGWPVWRATLGAAIESTAGAGPFRGMAALTAAAGHLGAALFTPALLLAAFGAGRPLARWAGTRAPVGSLAPVAGFGAWALLVQGLGYGGLLFPRLLAGLALAGAVGGVAQGRWERTRSPARRLVPDGALLPALVTAVMVGVLFLLTRLPDTHEDARLYHFAAPEQYLALHRITAEPWNCAWHVALGAEMLAMTPWALGGITAAKQVNLALLLAGCFVLTRLVRRLGSGRDAEAPGWWACAWWVTAGLVVDQTWQGMNDVAASVPLVAAGCCLVESGRGKSRCLPLAGWFIGQAVGTKYPAVLFGLGLGAAVALATRRQSAAGWTAPVLLAALPCVGWPAANWLTLGNPAYPFLSGVFPTINWGPFYESSLHASVRSFSPPEALLPSDRLSGWWRVLGEPATGSPALITMAPWALIGARDRSTGRLRLAALLGYAAWSGSERMARYLAPLIPMIAALAAAIPVPDGSRPRWMATRAPLTALAGVTAVLAAGSIMAPDGWRHLLGQMSTEDLWSRRYTTWEGVRRQVNATVPPGGRIYAIGETKRLGFLPRVLSSSPVTEPLFWKFTRESASVQEVRRRVRQSGITHLLYNFISAEYRTAHWFSGPPWEARQAALYHAYLRRYARFQALCPIDNRNGGFYLVELQARPTTPPAAWVPFLPGAEQVAARIVALRDAGRMAEALAAAEAVRRNLPGLGLIDNLDAYCRYRLGDYPGAARRAKPGVVLGQYDGLNLAVYAQACLYTGDLDDAERSLKLGLAWLPEAAPSHRLNLAWAGILRARRALARGERRQAERRLAGSARLLEALPDRMPPDLARLRAENRAELAATERALGREGRSGGE